MLEIISKNTESLVRAIEKIETCQERIKFQKIVDCGSKFYSLSNHLGSIEDEYRIANYLIHRGILSCDVELSVGIRVCR